MANTTTVDSSLWWHPFADFLSELETASLSFDLSPNLVKKLEENRAWFVETVSRFKPPNEKSKAALNSQIVKVGSHQLLINSEFKDVALNISSYLCLDEVQSYILVERQQDQHNVAFDSIVQESLHAILLQYYIERQCLLKCTRRILMHALYVGKSLEEKNVVMEETLKLISDGLESKLISVLHGLLSATHPKDMDIDLFTLWVEETLIEDNLVLDVLFLVYYESFSICNGEKWKKLCSLYKVLSVNYTPGAIVRDSNGAIMASRAQVLSVTYTPLVPTLLFIPSKAASVFTLKKPIWVASKMVPLKSVTPVSSSILAFTFRISSKKPSAHGTISFTLTAAKA